MLLALPASEQNPFWGTYARFAGAAAKDLGIKLTVVFTSPNSRFEYVERVTSAIMGPSRPEYFVAFPYVSKLEELLLLAEKAGVRVVTFNSGVSDPDRKQVGDPRNRFKNWLLHSQADDERAGYDLAKSLIPLAREKFKLASSETVLISAIGGAHDTASSTSRKEGFLEFFNRPYIPVALNQYVASDWSYEYGQAVAAGLFSRYEKRHAVWTAAIPLGRAVIDTWKALYPGEPLPAIGSIGWDEQAIRLLEKGDLAVVLGGHFMEGAWLLTLIGDHYNGIDFAQEIGRHMLVPLRKLDAQNRGRVKAGLTSQDWSDIGFRRFSKCFTPSLRHYDFSIENVLRK